MNRTPKKPVYKIVRNPSPVGADQLPFALIHPDSLEIVHVAPTPERCSGYAFRSFGEAIEVRHSYLEGE